MNQDQQTLMNNLRAQLEQLKTQLTEASPEEKTSMEQEVKNLDLPQIQSTQDEVKEDQEVMPELEGVKLAKAISKMTLSQVTKLRKFSKGENFAKFCERFMEYCNITNIADNNLYLLFLQNVDDETYTTLKSVELSPDDKSGSESACCHSQQEHAFSIL